MTKLYYVCSRFCLVSLFAVTIGFIFEPMSILREHGLKAQIATAVPYYCKRTEVITCASCVVHTTCEQPSPTVIGCTYSGGNDGCDDQRNGYQCKLWLFSSCTYLVKHCGHAVVRECEFDFALVACVAKCTSDPAADGWNCHICL